MCITYSTIFGGENPLRVAIYSRVSTSKQDQYAAMTKADKVTHTAKSKADKVSHVTKTGEENLMDLINTPLSKAVDW